MTKYKIYFSFNLNNCEWCWDKTFYSDNITITIENYLLNKNLPMDICNLKWKIKKQ